MKFFKEKQPVDESKNEEKSRVDDFVEHSEKNRDLDIFQTTIEGLNMEELQEAQERLDKRKEELEGK